MATTTFANPIHLYRRVLNKSKHFYIPAGNCVLKRKYGLQQEKMEDGPLPFSKVPSLSRVPFFGSFLEMYFSKDWNPKRQHIFMSKLVDKYGPIFVIQTFSFIPIIVVVTNPEDFATFMRSTMKNPIRNAFHALKHIRVHHPENYFEKKSGILPENNKEWWRVRQRITKPLMNPANHFLPQIDNITLEFMNVISKFQKANGEMPENFLDELYKWALESVGMVALNKRLGCLEQNLKGNSPQMMLINTVNDMFEAMNSCETGGQMWRFFATQDYKRLQKDHQVLLDLVSPHITEAENRFKSSKMLSNDEHQSILDMLLLRTDGDIGVSKSNPEGLTRKDVVTFIIDMFMAGIDTTAHTVGFTLYLLARNPSAQRKLQEEIDSVVGGSKEPITEDQISKLRYLKACIKESLRLFPLATGLTRVIEEDLVLSGYHIPKGCQLVGLTYLSSRSEEQFERALEYLPERWLRARPFGKIHPFASVPFSMGRRICIGKRIAEQELYTFLIRAFQRYDVKYKYGDMEMVTRLVNVPSEPLRFQFLERTKK